MLNLLAFWPGKEAHESYLQYGKAFGESIGKRRGGKAKIVGKVVVAAGQGTGQKKRQEREGDHQDGWWDEVALAHYPSRFFPSIFLSTLTCGNLKTKVVVKKSSMFVLTCLCVKQPFIISPICWRVRIIKK